MIIIIIIIIIFFFRKEYGKGYHYVGKNQESSRFGGSLACECDGIVVIDCKPKDEFQVSIIIIFV